MTRSTIDSKRPDFQDQLASRPDLVLFIAYPYPPCPEVGAKRPSHFAKYLQRLDYNVKVITAFQDDPARPEVVLVSNRQQMPNRNTLRGAAEVGLRKFFFPCDEGVLWAADAARAAARIIQQYRRPVVFSTFPPLNSHLAAWLLKRKYDFRWLADFRDPLAGSPGRELANSRLRLGAIPDAVDRFVERGIFRDADVLIANTDTVLEKWRTRYPTAAHKTAHIWNGFDPEEAIAARPVPTRPARVIAHVGSIYSGRHPGPLLEGVERLIRNDRLDPKRILIHLVGHIAWSLIPDRELFRRLIDVGCLKATGEVLPQDQARQLTCESDYLLLLDVIIAGGGQQLPSKIFEYVLIGRPILAITTRGSPAERVLAGSGVRYACIYDDSRTDEVDAAVLKLFAMPTEPVRASEWFYENFDAMRRARALAALIGG